MILLIGATPIQLDVHDSNDLVRSLNGVETVPICVDQDTARVAQFCLEHSIHYLNVSASHELLTQIEPLNDLTVRRSGHGPAQRRPGARRHQPAGTPCHRPIRRRRYGDRRAPRLGRTARTAAIEWTLDGLASMGDSRVLTSALATAPALPSRPRVRNGVLTALTRVHIDRRLDALPTGVWHLEQVVEPVGFLTVLAADGFDLESDAPRRTPTAHHGQPS